MTTIDVNGRNRRNLCAYNDCTSPVQRQKPTASGAMVGYCHVHYDQAVQLFERKPS